MQSSRTITKISTWLAGVVALLVMCLPPLSYGIFSYQYLQGSVTTEAEINSRIISDLINANPLLWHYEEMRLEELLAIRPDSGESESRRLVDLQGRLIAASDSPLAPPLFKITHEVMDAGHAVARLEIARSLQPLLLKTGVATLIGLFLGMALFIPLRILPIRALKKAEKEREKYFSFFRTSADLMCIADPHGSFLKTNPAFKKTLGYSEEELVLKPILEFIHPDDRQATVDEIARQQQRGFTDSFSNRYLCKDGSIKWLSWRVNVSKDDGIVYATARDVTEKKKAEETLRESRSLLHTILENVPIRVFWKDIDLNYLGCNSAFAHSAGYSQPEDLLGKDDFQMCWREQAEFYRADDKRIIDSKTAKIDIEKEQTTPDGQTILVRTSKVPLFDGENNVIGMLGIDEDITERKKTESELRKFEKLESIGTLAGGIAHDFNNVLTGLYGNLALVKMKLASDHPGFRFLEAAEQSMSRTTALTNRLLTFAKGGGPVTESMNLISLIEEVVNLSLSGSNVKPMITSEGNPWQVRAEHSQIQQVFANLTTNAREAMPGGGLLAITMENAELADKAEHGLPAGKYLRITMTDEGIGIAPDLLGKIFDPYYTTKEMGSGLGLATAYSIINKHGGHIRVASQLGKGTTFTIYLPAAEVEEESPLTQPGVTQVPLTQGAKILVMDDEEMILNMLNEMLGELGFAVETVVEGQQAIDIYQQAVDTGKPFTIVILDLTIPGGMGGQEAARGILQIDPEAKMIVSSGYADDPIVANYTDHGFKGVASKPYSLNKLSGVLDQVMKKG